ncbi:MAG: GMC family oxidoreductase N-terminal domain-containing protein [Gammaproteobacteria bacterium]|nr:GMC family oxidoreductase N-terminal domain-containing protein [Gammaproteobacteria bacterium]MDH5801630.1 GMC family oxidoreductase N-terminal domain-containing protein [Gammaproteobacteria bacterium]
MDESTHQDLLQHYDVIIIGGGSSGSVMANRLSKDISRKVLLLESGPEQPQTDGVKAAVRNGNQPAVMPGLNWKIRTYIKGEATKSDSTAPSGRKHASIFDYEAGRLLGGSSAINAVQALRGAPIDFDEWAQDCGQEWSWNSVLPYFRILEDDPQGDEVLHGRGGPMPIRRERREDLTLLQNSLYEVCLDHGFSETPDHNDPETTGVGVIPKNVVDGVRMSTAMTYLQPARKRENLHILTGAHVHKLIIKNRKCEGVLVERGGELRPLTGERIVLCAGAMNTPPILMRSGIGNPRLLQPMGIDVSVPLSGVGEHLMDHPVVGIWGIPKRDTCEVGEPLRQTLLRYSSSDSGYENDMHICMMAGIDVAHMFPKLAASSSATTIAGLTTCFNKSTSGGYVRIRSADPYEAPNVVINCLADKTDVAPLKEGVRIAWDLMQSPRLRQRFDKVLAWSDGMIQSDMALNQAINSFVRPSAHACGSARMGSSPDKGAVVDAKGKVYGVDNLWIADGSIMPMIPSSPPHLTCLMIAEKLAAEQCLH